MKPGKASKLAFQIEKKFLTPKISKDVGKTKDLFTDVLPVFKLFTTNLLAA